MDANGWNKYEKMVLSELKEAKEDRGSINRSLVLIRLEIVRLKMHASFWGVIGGGLMSVIVGLVFYNLK